VLFKTFFRTFFAFLETEWHRILISILAWNTMYYSKILFSLVKSTRAWIRVLSIGNFSSGSFWEKSLFRENLLDLRHSDVAYATVRCICDIMLRMQHPYVVYTTSCGVCNVVVAHTHAQLNLALTDPLLAEFHIYSQWTKRYLCILRLHEMIHWQRLM